MLDRIFATISMLGVIAFMGVVMWFVREPDLIIVSVVAIAIGVFYIWQELKAGGSHVEGGRRDDSSDG